MTPRPPPTGPAGKPTAGAASKGPVPRLEEPPVSAPALRALSNPPVQGPARVAGARTPPPSRAVQDLWVARLKQRDPEALREVVAAFGERLTAVVSGLLRDQDAVEDVVQETFTKAWYRIDAFQGEAGLFTWLYRVAVNGCKDHIKRRSRRPAGSLDDLGAEPGFAAPSTPPVEGLARRELRLAVREALGRLPERFRSVLALREIEGLSYQDIASVLGLSLGTVESRLFRARQRLAALLGEGGAAGRGADQEP